MSPYTTFDDIRSINEKIDRNVIIKEAYSRQYPSVFLSHSSADHESLPAVIKILENHGGRVYIDDGDPRLSGKVNPNTAEVLRETIGKCSKLVVLVTTNTKDSRWVPWELGLGDGKKFQSSIAIFPVVKDSLTESWHEQEYLGLYKRIVWSKFKGKDKSEWMVWDHNDNTATGLGEWLR
ncbi:MAG: toll/interleukin-1 receptor domain-containing protein [Candidatus Kuenenia stuttgartiensis]|uniref:TIR domain-containing protein n=1 Tax=Kuenenia stuttgartiensis TaxID=174633 RepID=A0A2C9CJ07_KUEST|nr:MULTISPECIES: toll/interleukin-1 receptor domain-containing protein [Kuenenia]MBW7942021.1 toll/interleukin-1 receptor domain-containing protein [Candidatus Kuenenia stuttgartiensis]MCZ7611943.1 toll/interleukin-1 receptor domain-containing protein [Ignavibacterium sp.]MCZ7620935.1 toll/interleukin-1 receptor domain-containing protein [Candidatus Kuenenia sp.]SOH05879.1 hypothetical protein KSMBR1_3405 [Candidatus Kuenenia stuttgartiensis]